MTYENEFSNNNGIFPENSDVSAGAEKNESTNDTEINENVFDTAAEEKTENVFECEKPNAPHAPCGQHGGDYGRSAGIRYGKDKNSADGNYTWSYSNVIENEKAERKKSRKGLAAVAVVASVVVLTGIIGVGAFVLGISGKYLPIFAHGRITYYGDGTTSDPEQEVPMFKTNTDTSGAAEIVSIPEPGSEIKLTKQQIAVKCKPSSVGIEVTQTVSYGFYGYTYKTSGVGSGFILSEDGYIATNSHVVEGAEEITVMLDDGTKHEAKLIGADSVTDLAVIKIEANGLVPMEIGNSDIMTVGDSVIAIGTPAGIEFAGTVTDGIISAINRDVEVKSASGAVKTMTLMQTNAAINPGNSGGPLINDRGQVIGINTLKLTSDYEGIGFSIPINSALKIFNQLVSDGEVTDYESSFVTGNGAIGITKYEEVSKAEADFYGIPQGIIVIQLDVTGSAHKAGLTRGDIITAFNGTKITTVSELNELKSKFKAGDKVTLTVFRDSDTTVDITFKLDIMK